MEFLDAELAKQLDCPKSIVLGYRDSQMFLKDEFEPYGDVFVSTEDGSAGTKGNVIDAIKEQGVEGSVIYACGPTPMLKGIQAYALENGIEAQISLEERMACGIGACLACVCQSKEVDEHSKVHNKRVCKDGPVFDAGRWNCNESFSEYRRSNNEKPCYNRFRNLWIRGRIQ